MCENGTNDGAMKKKEHRSRSHTHEKKTFAARTVIFTTVPQPWNNPQSTL